jgi:hypothetical protein
MLASALVAAGKVITKRMDYTGKIRRRIIPWPFQIAHFPKIPLLGIERTSAFY